jgi:glycosyltransferase involved in cell wall biosynthesis
MTGRLKVAIVAPTLAILGGHSVQASALLQGWSADPDVDAWLVPINPTPPRLVRGWSRVKYLRTLATQAAYWPLLWRELRAADVVHVFSASYTSFLLSPLPAMVVARALGRPVLVNYHSGEAPDHLKRSWIARKALAASSHVVVPSRFLAEVFRGCGLAAEIIPNVIDRARFPFHARHQLRPRFLSTRNLEPVYNVGCTLRAFRRIQQAHPDATLTLVGSGSQEGALRGQAAALGVANVTFAGRVPPADMWRHYADADIYLQSPDIDNMPLSVLEAFASGLPVVSTCAGGVPAMLTDGVHGLLVPLDDDAAMARGALRLLNDPELARRVAEAAYASTDAFVWAGVRERWLAAYRRLGRPVLRSSAGTVEPA